MPIDTDALRARYRAERDKRLTHDAVGEDFDFYGAFLRFHHGDDIATAHGIAWFLQPLDKLAGFHVRTQRGHAKFGHRLTSRRPARP